MKRKIFSVLFALVLVCSLGLMTAVPVAAGSTLEVSKWTEYAKNPIFGQGVEGPKAYYQSVIYDIDEFSGHGVAAKYKMWYGTEGSQTGLATSDDGISWTDQGVVMSDGYHATVEYYSDGFSGANSGDNPSAATMYYRMWYWDVGTIYAVSAIGYTESPDGVNWYNYQPCQNGTVPIVSGGDPWWNRGSYGPCDVLYNPAATNTGTDWTFTMYYDGTTGGDEAIGLGFSEDGITWTAYDADDDGKAAPVLQGTYVDGDWDKNYVSRCTVIKGDDEIYRMWFSGGTGAMNHGIGYATSSDGINWDKDANNPIFYKTDGISWRADRTYCPMVIEDGGTYKMWFTGVGSAYSIGYATNTNPDAAYTTIQAAIDAANPAGGDTIKVAPGIYSEWQDNGYGQSAGNIIDKPLHLQGSGDDCIIRGKTGTAYYMSYSPIVWVKADNVEIDHFKFDGATYTEEEPKGLRSYGIQSAWKVSSTDYAATNLNIHHNTFVFIGTAVTQDRAGGGDITVAYNTMVRETRSVWYDPTGAEPGSYVEKTLGGGGFKFDYVIGGNVHDNTGIETPGVGIFLHGCDGLTIGPNNVVSAPNTTDPSDIGIHIQTCSNIRVTGNTVSNFTAGPKEYYNDGTTGAGIRIISSNENVTIDGNQLSNNTVGVLVTGVSGSPEIHRNNIEDNTEFGVLNCASWIGKDQTYTPASVTIDAKYNWWGRASGPSRQLPHGKWCGKGDKVSDNVDYKPWLHKSKENVVPKKKPAYAQSVDLYNTGEYGWNTFSTPIFLDDEADTWNELYELTDLDYSMAYRFDSDNQTFVNLTVADEYAIKPGEGFFIKMNDVGSLPILYSTQENLIPPSRPLTVGWNLIGLANLEGMGVDNAFASIATVPGLAGYSQVVSPIGNAEPGPVLTDGTLYVGESYWVYMLGERTLAGFTMTPVEWVP